MEVDAVEYGPVEAEAPTGTALPESLQMDSPDPLMVASLAEEMGGFVGGGSSFFFGMVLYQLLPVDTRTDRVD